jgi:hypothetical protein
MYFGDARNLGARGMSVVEWGRCMRRSTERAAYESDESEQSRYFNDSVNIFEEAGVDTAFWCTFACHNLLKQQEFYIQSFGDENDEK